MVDIKIDEIYRKPSNFFQLEISSIGKIYTMPKEFELHGNQWDSTIYDKTTGNRLSCVKFANNLQESEAATWMLKSFITKHMGIQLKGNSFISSKSRNAFDSSYISYSLAKEISHADRDMYKIFDGFEYRIVLLENKFCLCINPHLKIKTEASVKSMIQNGLPPDQLFLLGADYQEGMERKRCNIVSATVSNCNIRDLDADEDKEIVSEDVFVLPKPDILQNLLSLMKRKSNIIEIQRKYSFLSDKEASKARFQKTIEIASGLTEKIFPLQFGDFRVEFIPKTINLRT